MEIGRSYLPNNNWLKNRLRSNVNIKNTCNAFWNGSTINFYRSGNNCANLGEISGVIAHEWGHGMDDNDLVPGISRPSGEGIADIYAALYDGVSCIGRGGFEDKLCSLRGDSCKTCTGVRDIDYMQHVSQKPHTASWAKNNCGDSVHCKGHVYSEAIWSLWKRELPALGYDDQAAYAITADLVYIGAGNVAVWYEEKDEESCATFNGYKAFLSADAANSNTNVDLNKGTPRECFNDGHCCGIESACLFTSHFFFFLPSSLLYRHDSNI